MNNLSNIQTMNNLFNIKIINNIFSMCMCDNTISIRDRIIATAFTKFINNLNNHYKTPFVSHESSTIYISQLWKNIHQYNKPKSSGGYILVGDRYTDEKNSYFFLERTSRTPDERLDEWIDRKKQYEYISTDSIFAESFAHQIFSSTRLCRNSTTKTKGSEVEWFQFKYDLTWDNINSIIIELNKFVTILVEQYPITQKININTASIIELQTIPSIGKARAEFIIDHRKYIPFNTIKDLMKCKTIKIGIFNTLKNFITTENKNNLEQKSENKNTLEQKSENDDIININTSTYDELMTLDNIGKTLASRIISFRETSKFTNLHELTNIKGIGNKTFLKNKNKICL